VRRAAFAGRLLGELEERYRRYVLDGFEALRREWESYSCLTGCTVTVAGPDGRAGRALRGCVTGIDVEGALCLRAEDGRAIRVLAGDVTLAGAYRDRPGRRGGR
jgi:biotin-(acetyl-CoA carboxylase) ligase